MNIGIALPNVVPGTAGWITGTAAVGADAITARVDEFAAAGATDVVICPCTSDHDQLEQLAAIALPTPAFA